MECGHESAISAYPGDENEWKGLRRHQKEPDGKVPRSREGGRKAERNAAGGKDFMEYVFPAMGLRFISVNDRYGSSAGRGMAGGADPAFKNLLYQMYAMDGSRKVKTAKRTRNERGEYTAGLVPYGYRKDPEDVHKFVIDGSEAAVVKEIFMLAADGKGCAGIARMLNDRGEPTPYDRKYGTRGGRHQGRGCYHAAAGKSVKSVEIPLELV